MCRVVSTTSASASAVSTTAPAAPKDVEYVEPWGPAPVSATAAVPDADLDALVAAVHLDLRAGLADAELVAGRDEGRGQDGDLDMELLIG